MRFVSGVNIQKLGRFIDGHVINSALHQAKEMVVEVWYKYRLVYHQMKYFTCSRIVKGNNAANCLIGLGTKGRVISHGLYRSIIV